MIRENNGELVIVEGVKEDAPVDATETKEVVEVKKEEPKEELLIVAATEEVQNETDKEEEIAIPEGDDEHEEIVDYEEEVPSKVATESKEELIITPMGQEGTVATTPKEEIVVTESISPLDAVNKAIADAGLTDVLTEGEEEIVDGFIARTKVAESTPKAERVIVNKVNSEKVETAMEAESLLRKFKNYITSAKFDKVCETSAQKHGVKKCAVKNKVIAGFLGTIADVLGLSLTIVGDVTMSAVNFVAFIINKILEFAIDNVKKLVTLLTLNCGELN